MEVFDTLKIYSRKKISLEEVNGKLIDLKYKRVNAVLEEGDFSIRGDTLEIFPVNFSLPLRVEWEYDIVSRIYSFDKTLNKKITDYEFLIIIPYIKRIQRSSSEDFPIDAVLRIKAGDFVVHSRYGIGRFKGVKKLTVRDKEDFYFEVEYDKKDKIYVSKEEAHLIQKYVSLSAKTPRLTRLGTKEWTRIKAKVESGIKKLALQLIKVEAQRKIIGGTQFSPDSDWQNKFEADFPYKETDDQLKATAETKQDMESPYCMDRIICGDVGYGKTEVAMRAAFKAVMNAKQAAFLVPTTVLAYQHYTNLVKRLKEFPFCVEMLSRFRTKIEQIDILKRLNTGKIDIIVGTHRLLSADVSFKDLGLLIIDEEHKFGVEHKERIKNLKVGVEVLTLTATPIPRTLYMSLVGLKNVSLIRTAPQQRVAVKTKVVEFCEEFLKEVILKEINRGGQVFFIHNRIESINKIERILRRRLPPSARIAIIHGRLSGNTIEKVMIDFTEKRIDVLLTTAIVESGIDIPGANTIIINDAHCFGLADLHQLRGRVGRLDVQAYAYLVIPKWDSISFLVRGRLKMIEEFSHLGAGFEIAMSDLELRGAGNILGKEQHGFVGMVGFDLYCRLMKKEIEYLKQAFDEC